MTAVDGRRVVRRCQKRLVHMRTQNPAAQADYQGGAVVFSTTGLDGAGVYFACPK
jgi:hypothetical protein